MERRFVTHQVQSAQGDLASPSQAAGVPVAHGVMSVATVDGIERRPRAGGSARALREPYWPKEIGGPEGPEPTRYGDWEHKGICSDF